jgi:hypothetical protein
MSFDGWRHECPKHESQETAVYDGETCDACGLSEGEWRLRQATADQLRAECARQNLNVIDWPPVRALVAERDDARRELSQRSQLVGSLNRDVETYKAERDDWKRRYEAQVKRSLELVDESAEWKRRTEAKLTGASPLFADELGEWVTRANAARSPVARLDVVQEGLKRGFIKMTLARRLLDANTPEEHARFVERGPGIARAPERDNSVAWLDEDLLCEDA